MNINHMRLCAERQHKSTMAIVEKLVGVPEFMIHSCPIVVKKAKTLIFYPPGIKGQVDTDYINSYIMNGAFALELKMKYLHALETNTILDEGHRLRELFKGLTEESKEKVSQSFRVHTKSSEFCKEINKVLASEKIPYSWNLHTLLTNSDMAFERWRYIYEEDADSTWFAGYSEIQFALNARLTEIQQ